MFSGNSGRAADVTISVAVIVVYVFSGNSGCAADVTINVAIIVVYVVGNGSGCATHVTSSVTCVVICVSTYNVESVEDLFSDVSVTCFRYVSSSVVLEVFLDKFDDGGCIGSNFSIGDVNEDNVLHGVSIEESVDRGRSGEDFTEVDGSVEAFEYGDFNAGKLVVETVYIFNSLGADGLNFNNVVSEVAEHSAKFSLIERFDHSAGFSVKLVEVSINEVKSGKSNGVSFEDTEIYEGGFDGFSSVCDSGCYGNSNFNSVKANEFFPIDIQDNVGIDLAEHSKNVFKFRARGDCGDCGHFGKSNFSAVDVISYVFNVGKDTCDDFVESACAGDDSGVNGAESIVDLVAVKCAVESTEDLFEYFVGVGVCGILDFGSEDVTEVNNLFINNDVEVESKTGECVGVAEENDLCVGVDCVYSGNELSVFNVELNVAVEVSFYSVCYEVSYGNFNGVGCIFAECSFDCFFGQSADHCSNVRGYNFVDLLEEHINNLNGVRISFIKTCFNESAGDSVESFFNVSNVFFAYESSPIHFGDFSIAEETFKTELGFNDTNDTTEVVVDHVIDLFFLFVSYERIQSCITNNKVSKEVCNSSLSKGCNRILESAVDVCSNVTEDLFGSKAGDHAFGVTDGDEVSLCDDGSVDVVPAHGSELVFIVDTHLVSEHFCINSIFAADSEVEGICSYSVICSVCGVREECLEKSVEVSLCFCDLSDSNSVSNFTLFNCIVEELFEVRLSNCNEVSDESFSLSDLFLNLSFNVSDSFENSVYFCVNNSDSVCDFSVNTVNDISALAISSSNSDFDESCEFIEVGLNLFGKCNDICVEFCVELVSVCDNSAESFDGSNGAVSGNCELSCNFVTVVFVVAVDPVFNVSYSVDCFNEVSVHLSDVAFLYSKLVSFCIELVVVCEDVIAEDYEVVNSFVNNGVLVYIGSTNCFKEIVVTFFGGMCADTVTDKATAKETEKSLENFILAHSCAHVVGEEVKSIIVTVVFFHKAACSVYDTNCNAVSLSIVVVSNHLLIAVISKAEVIVDLVCDLFDEFFFGKIFYVCVEFFNGVVNTVKITKNLVGVVDDLTAGKEGEDGSFGKVRLVAFLVVFQGFIGVSFGKFFFDSCKEFHVNFVLVGLACKDCSFNIFFIIQHSAENVFQNDGKILDCCEAVKAENGVLACFDDSGFKCEVNLNEIQIRLNAYGDSISIRFKNSHLLFRAKCVPCFLRNHTTQNGHSEEEAVLIANSIFFKCFDFFESDVGNVHESIHKTPNIAVSLTVFTNDRFMETAANDIVKTVCIGIDDNFNLGSSGVVDGSISVCFIVYYLNGSVGGEMSVYDIKSVAHVFTEVVVFAVELELHAVKGVHKTNDHDFNVGVQFNDSVKDLGVVVAEIENSVDEEVCDGFDLFIFEAFQCFILRKHCEVLVAEFDYLFNKCGIASIHEVFKLNVVNNFSVAGAAEAETSHKLVHDVSAEFSVTEAHGDDVSFSDLFDVKFLKLCEEFFVDDLTGFLINKVPAVSADIINKAGVAVFNIFTAANEEEKVAGKHCGSSKLAVVYVNQATHSEVLSELAGVSVVAIVTYFTLCENVKVFALTVVVHAVAVGHGVAKRNVVEIGLFCCMIVIMADSAYSRSENAEQHEQRHEHRKSFCTHFLEIHFDSFPRS